MEMEDLNNDETFMDYNSFSDHGGGGFGCRLLQKAGGAHHHPAPTTTAPTTEEATKTEPETTEESTEASGEAVDLSNRYHMLQGTVVKTTDDAPCLRSGRTTGRTMTSQFPDSGRGDGDRGGRPDRHRLHRKRDRQGRRKIADADLVVALPEQEEWTIYRETGTTMFNAMSSFTVKTDDNRELAC